MVGKTDSLRFMRDAEVSETLLHRNRLRGPFCSAEVREVGVVGSLYGMLLGPQTYSSSLLPISPVTSPGKSCGGASPLIVRLFRIVEGVLRSAGLELQGCSVVKVLCAQVLSQGLQSRGSTAAARSRFEVLVPSPAAQR